MMCTLLSEVICDIDKAMCAGDFHALMEITKITDFETMLTNDVESSYAQCTDIVQSNGESVFQPESELLLTHALLITQRKKLMIFQSMHAVVVTNCTKESL